MAVFDFMANLYNPDGQPKKEVAETEANKHFKTMDDFEKVGANYEDYLEEAKNNSTVNVGESNPALINEVSWMLELNSFINEVTIQINCLVQLIPMSGTSAIQSLIGYMRVIIPKLEAFKPKAESLSKAGSNQMSERLEPTLSDIKTAYATYLNMYGGSVRTDNNIARINNTSAAETTNTILETNINIQGVYDKANNNWDDKF